MRPRIAETRDATAPISCAMQTWGLCLKQSSGGLMARRTQSHRRKAFQQQDGCCYYCELPVWEVAPLVFSEIHRVPPRVAKWLRSTAEHVCARCDGGKDRKANIVSACLWCNSRRHQGRQHCAPDASTYRARVRQLVAAGKWHPFVESRSASAKRGIMSAARPVLTSASDRLC